MNISFWLQWWSWFSSPLLSSTVSAFFLSLFFPSLFLSCYDGFYFYDFYDSLYFFFCLAMMASISMNSMMASISFSVLLWWLDERRQIFSDGSSIKPTYKNTILTFRQIFPQSVWKYYACAWWRVAWQNLGGQLL